MNSTHDSKSSIKALNLAPQKTSKESQKDVISHSASTPSSLIDLKHSTQVHDKDTTIHIDTNQSEHYRYLLKNSIDGLEEKSLFNRFDSLKKQKKAEMKAKREEVINALHFHKQQLDTIILLIKKRNKLRTKDRRSRALKFIIPMIGTAIFLIYKYYQLKDYYEERNHLLEQNLNEIINYLERFYDTLSHALRSYEHVCRSKYLEVANFCIYTPNTFFSGFNDRCESPYTPINFNEHYEWCANVNTARYILFVLSDTFSNSLGGYIGFILFCLLLGEIAPFIMILITLLTDDNSVVARHSIDLDSTEFHQIVHIANEHNIHWERYSYPMLLSTFESESKKIAVHLDLFNKAENMRMAFLSGMCEKDTQKTPIRKLFYSANSNNLLMGEPRVIAKIFAFAGISVCQLNKSAKKAARTAFESGGHVKNIIRQNPNNNRGFPHIFIFFGRLKNEQARFKTHINHKEHPFFKQLTNQKKFSAQEGKAHNQHKILRNIYEFAGLIPKGKHQGFN